MSRRSPSTSRTIRLQSFAWAPVVGDVLAPAQCVACCGRASFGCCGKLTVNTVVSVTWVRRGTATVSEVFPDFGLGSLDSTLHRTARCDLAQTLMVLGGLGLLGSLVV